MPFVPSLALGELAERTLTQLIEEEIEDIKRLKVGEKKEILDEVTGRSLLSRSRIPIPRLSKW
ncbi:MAG: hypothetical protein ACRD2L_03435 [Terriglobia bacterium]